MPQRNDMAAKRRVEYDGEEIAGLVRFAEAPLEKGTLEVPSFDKIRKIQNGQTTVPDLELTYKVRRDGEAYQFFRQYYDQNETKDVVEIQVDAAGTEYARTLYPECECTMFVPSPEYDAATPTYAQVRIRLAPYDAIPLDLS